MYRTRPIVPGTIFAIYNDCDKPILKEILRGSQWVEIVVIILNLKEGYMAILEKCLSYIESRVKELKKGKKAADQL